MTTQTIKMYGTTWCGDCRRAKMVFDAFNIPYDYTDLGEDAEALAYVKSVNDGKQIVPTIVFPDGDILVEPSNNELGKKLERYQSG
ncbi:MAG: glutaredoxin domain-containing protein [Chloroflexi bacterium]|nr:glutaredoxin domain-containing protein [Chloroflexota bacterium]